MKILGTAKPRMKSGTNISFDGMRVQCLLLIGTADEEALSKVVGGRGYIWSDVDGRLGRGRVIMVQCTVFRRSHWRIYLGRAERY